MRVNDSNNDWLFKKKRRKVVVGNEVVRGIGKAEAKNSKQLIARTDTISWKAIW